MKTPFTILEYGTGTKGVMFIFGGWRTSAIMYRAGIREFTKLGWQCILFLPNNKLIAIHSPYQDIVDAGVIADRYIRDYIANTPKGTIYMAMGVSLGTLFASEVTKRHKEITKLVLSAPFGDFADHVPLWDEHWYFGRVLRSQPTDAHGSVEVLSSIGNMRNIKKLADKQIIILYGQNDNVTHAPVAQSFITKIREINPQTLVHISRGGHHTGIFKNYYWLQKNHRSFFEL